MLYKIAKNINNIFYAWAGFVKVNNLPRKKKLIVFYAEASADWMFLNPIIESLDLLNEEFIRITSDRDDKLLSHPNVYYIGFGSARTFLFRTIQADVFIMTLPDLGLFYLKRSLYPVHYFYVFHSLVSTHRIYRESAFDAYDTILCVGDHHIKEIRKRESVFNLSKKNLEKHGYGRLDALIAENNKKKISHKNNKISSNVLIAPSWGECSLVNQHLDKLIEILISANFKVTLRLHPMTMRHHPNLSRELKKKYQDTGSYFFDPQTENIDSVLNSIIMISEWSGAALEYAFATERPVIFVNTKPKINNPKWEKINLPCLEETIRSKIGTIVPEYELHTIPQVIKKLLSNIEIWSEKIRNIRKETVFNVGNSGRVGSEIICKMLALKENNDKKY